MKKTQFKNAVRAVWKNKVSWISISIIVMLACGVYFSTIFFADSLEQELYDYVADSKMEDFNILATNGLREDEIEELKETDGILDAEGTWRLGDSSLIFNEEETDVDIYGLTERISLPDVEEGALPHGDGECALTKYIAEELGIGVGDTVQLVCSGDYPDGFLKSDSFTVTAIVRHPDCMSEYYGGLALLDMDAFDADAVHDNYSCIRIDADLPFDNSVGLEGYSDSVSELRQSLRQELKSIGSSHDEKMAEEAKEAAEKVIAEAIEESNGMDDYAVDEEYDENGDYAESGYVFYTRDDMDAYASITEDIRILRVMGFIFFLFFAFVASIVIISTVTIIIDNDKTYIGTMKALGFTDSAIVKCYLMFGVTAGALGMLLSIGAATVIQMILRNMVNPQFTIKVGGFVFEWKIFIILFLIMIAIAAVMTIAVTIYDAARYSAINLISGNTGKRITDEKKGKSRGSLYGRLIIRNMRTDIARVLVSILIIASSCIMVGIGVTIKDAFMKMMERSAEEITHYDMEVEVTSKADDGTFEEVEEYLNSRNLEYKKVCKTTSVYSYGNTEGFVNIVAGDSDIYPEYIELTNLKGKNEYNPDEDGIMVTNRISEATGLESGSRFELYDKEYHPEDAECGEVYKYYYGATFFLSQDDYRDYIGNDPEFNTFLVRTGEGDRDGYKEELKSSYHGLDVSYTDEFPGTLEGLMGVYSQVVYITIALSLIMSVFVLLNLVNIYVRRKKKEIILMAVNGFSLKKRIGYLMRESLLTLVTGLIIGVIAGCMMTEFLIRCIESSNVMFIRDVNPQAWVFAVIVETIFAVIINALSYRQLSKWQLTDINS